MVGSSQNVTFARHGAGTKTGNICWIKIKNKQIVEEIKLCQEN